MRFPAVDISHEPRLGDWELWGSMLTSAVLVAGGIIGMNYFLVNAFQYPEI
jgi:hypothetical protein